MATRTMDAIYKEHPAVHSGKPRHRAIADLTEGPRVLDFGCGTGDLLMLLQGEHPDWDLNGVDTSRTALDLLRANDFVGCCGVSLSGTGDYNTIIASQVLEHVENDNAIVQALKDALVPGGLLIVSVPNNGAIKSPDHKRIYTENSLQELLKCVGKPVLHSWVGEKGRVLMSVRKDKEDDS